ncbi:hypothetical protein BpHYR1_035998, partial [Brachionus plicatilis]
QQRIESSVTQIGTRCYKKTKPYLNWIKVFKFTFEAKNFSDVDNFLEKYGLYAFEGSVSK